MNAAFVLDYYNVILSCPTTGVTSYKVDLESRRVVVVGDIIPFQVLQSVAKVKNAELWTS